MSAVRTAQWLVNQVRADIGVFDRKLLRDGFPSDDSTAPVDILSYINEGLSIATATGFVKSVLSIACTQGVREYPIHLGTGDIIYVAFGNNSMQDIKKLKPIRVTELLRIYPSFLLTGTNTPNDPMPEWYYTDTPDHIGVFPPPSFTDTGGNKSLQVLVEMAPADLVEPNDTISRLQTRFHERVRYYAAWKLASSFSGNKDVDAADKLSERANLAHDDWEKFLSDLQGWAQAPEQSTAVYVSAYCEEGGDYGTDY